MFLFRFLILLISLICSSCGMSEIRYYARDSTRSSVIISNIQKVERKILEERTKSSNSYRRSILKYIALGLCFTGVQGHIQYEFELEWGTAGIGQGEFGSLVGIAVDKVDNVWVSDDSSLGVRIQEFNNFGNFLSEIIVGNTSEDNFREITIDDDNFIYGTVDDLNKTRKFNFTGELIQEWSTTDPEGIYADKFGDIWVAIDVSPFGFARYSNTGNFISSCLETGSGNGQFDSPDGIVVSSDGLRVYVADENNNRVHVMTPNCTFIDTYGTYDGLNGMDIDEDDTIYFTDDNQNIIILSSNGTLLLEFGTSGSGPGELESPFSLAIDSMRNIFVLDSGNSKIIKFRLNHTNSPTAAPTFSPTQSPTLAPTLFPTLAPISTPSLSPTRNPTDEDKLSDEAIIGITAGSIALFLLIFCICLCLCLASYRQVSKRTPGGFPMYQEV